MTLKTVPRERHIKKFHCVLALAYLNVLVRATRNNGAQGHEEWALNY
jgi:hypothetical protein